MPAEGNGRNRVTVNNPSFNSIMVEHPWSTRSAGFHGDL